MRKALVKKAVTLLLLLTIIVPGCFVRYYDVYGDNKQNLDNANNKKIFFMLNCNLSFLPTTKEVININKKAW